MFATAVRLVSAMLRIVTVTRIGKDDEGARAADHGDGDGSNDGEDGDDNADNGAGVNRMAVPSIR